MSVNIARFYGRERLQLDCEIITPMFLGNANQEAELRSAPFKGLLRYWWRVANGREYQNHAALLAAENEIFGSADEKTGGKSRVTVQVKAVSGMEQSKNGLGNPGNVSHRECEKTGGKTNPLNYLAGMGLIHYKKGVLHSYFPVGGRFQLSVESASDKIETVERTLGLFSRFAAIGSRSRNGWGSFGVDSKFSATPQPIEWKNAFDRDYPSALGKDSSGCLFWRTMQTHQDWKQCMRELADIYIQVRTDIDVKSGNPPDRHLLGYPVTNHSVGRNNWGNQGRHGSALRLIVRKEAEKYRGYILHLPHLFSKTMWSESEKQRQIDIWRKVHANLDKLCRRVAFEEGK